MKETILPPGQYWIGDSCYVIDPSQWTAFQASIDPESGLAEHQGHRSAVYRTKCGDGGYPDGSNREYSADSGLIAAVAGPLTLKNLQHRPWLSTMGQLIATDRPMHCSASDNGTLSFGNLQIETSMSPVTH